MTNPYLHKAARAVANMKRNGARHRRASNRRRMRYWIKQSFHYSIKLWHLDRHQRKLTNQPQPNTVALP